jgi:hypothetical protein
MKVVIFAGGYGSRLSEETTMRPKPMVEVGNRPIIWHIMKIYSCYGFNEFVVLAGYKADIIKSYFLDYARLNSDFTADLATGEIVWNRKDRYTGPLILSEDWILSSNGTQGAFSIATGEPKKRLHPITGQEMPWSFARAYGCGTALGCENLLTFRMESTSSTSAVSARLIGKTGSKVTQPRSTWPTRPRENTRSTEVCQSSSPRRSRWT